MTSVRARLKEAIAHVQRKPTAVELADLDTLLRRANPERVAGTTAPRFIGQQAATLTRESLASLSHNCFVMHKVDGLAALLAAFPATGSAAYTALFVCRNRVFAVDGVALPMRRGRVLIDGELCLRRRLSESVKTKLKAAARCVLDPDPAPVPAEDDEGEEELCYIAHDLIVDDEAHASGVRSRVGDAVCVQPAVTRLIRLAGLLQAMPTDDGQAASLAAAYFEATGKMPAITPLYKPAYLGRHVREALCTLPDCLYGVSIDGLIFLPGTGSYCVAASNPGLLKYKRWRANTGDFVFVRAPDGGYSFWVLNKENKARCISTRLWLGDTDEERAVSQSCLDAEAERLAAGGSPKTPIVCEFEPRVDDPDAFFALRDKYAGDREALVLAAGEVLAWRPILVRTDEKSAPNSERNFWTIVEALINCVTDEEIVAQLTTTH